MHRRRPAAADAQPGEKAKALSDLYKEVKRRCGERAAGAEPRAEETPRKPRDEPRAVTRRRRRPARAGAAKTAAPSPQVHRDEPPVPVTEETQLAPEKQARIDRAWNDYVASLPAEEEADERKREPGPRITQL